MRILFAGNSVRGDRCLRALVGAGHEIVTVIGNPSTRRDAAVVELAAREHGLVYLAPKRLDDDIELVDRLKALGPQLTVMAGYSPIVGERVLTLAPLGCLNLHGGKLPQLRGSSPLNWALIRGDREFTLSIIRANRGVDTGDVLAERTFTIDSDDTIADLHEIANREFPPMLVELVGRLAAGPVVGRVQDDAQASYYPLRFPDDGLIVWDLMTAEHIHNRIRALTDPYPGAFTFLQGRRVRLLRSKLSTRRYYGEPGYVYLKNQQGLLVCASDRCLWISRATFDVDDADALPDVARYGRFATARGALLEQAKLRSTV